VSKKNTTRAVPASRLSRIAMLGSLATRVASNVVTQGAGQLLKGQKPVLSNLLLTPKNIQRITDQLANMRGAAMKIGQLISMDSGDLLPPELSAILARLRDDAIAMPREQLTSLLDAQWGKNWQQNLLYFSFAPIAAASIGQVHKAITLEGQTLAIKVQYPGIKQSINSDVDNVASIIRLLGILPKEMDVTPLLDAAKQQLHDEADYHNEASMLGAYADTLGPGSAFVCPQIYAPLTTDNILAMTFIKGQGLDTLADEPQSVKNHLMGELFRLFFTEVFDNQLIQSDPNLANYLYLPDSQQIGLLDFGACRPLPKTLCHHYQQLLQHIAADNQEGIAATAIEIGLMNKDTPEVQRQAVVDIGRLACESIRTDGPYDFGQSQLLPELQNAATELTFTHNFWHLPPADAVLIHRKLAGLFLMAKRLNTQVDMRKITANWR
jgi:predicted unusual protein kinase regulating ubiquinone biosynthesis (AarF/ABC1/UbiB family)